MELITFGFLFALGAIADLPPPWQYGAQKVTVTDTGLEPGSAQETRKYQITYPANSSLGQKFPLIVFAHGFLEGGLIEQTLFDRHFKDLASYGFVVIAPNSCSWGCKYNSHQERTDFESACPKYTQWPSFVYENARAISYAKNATSQASWAALIDWSAGVGIAAHSMGGEAIMQLASASFARKYNVKAAVCEHCLACIESGDLLSTPAMFITGTNDFNVQPGWVKDAFKADTVSPKSFRNEEGRGHGEMLDLIGYNPAVAQHAAAFFKVWLNGDRGQYYDIMYGNGTTSFCGYAKMEECTHVMTTRVQLV